jgi:pantoate--beta-alanine ligase
VKRLTGFVAVRREVDRQRKQNVRVGLVPTMGALHEGHLSLLRSARSECDFVICSIFVNPMQFNQKDDLTAYPRNTRRDLALLREVECDLVFAPTDEVMYPRDFDTFVVPGALARPLEGRHRPGHFRGVATICMKLFAICKPHRAYFGQKDYQQALIIQRMVDDLNLDLSIRMCPIVRDSDGLALSSRNRFLTRRQKQQALAISHTLKAESAALRSGQRSPRAAESHGTRTLQRATGLDLDYFAVRHARTLQAPDPNHKDLIILAAARVGKTRLIDNVRVRLSFQP